jgi:hypothetical protein
VLSRFLTKLAVSSRSLEWLASRRLLVASPQSGFVETPTPLRHLRPWLRTVAHADFHRRWKVFKKIYIQYIDIVAGIAVTENEDIVVVDSVTPTVFIIGQNDFLRSIDCTDFMEEPSDIAVVGTY